MRALILIVPIAVLSIVAVEAAATLLDLAGILPGAPR